MKEDIRNCYEFHKAICDEELVFLFGTGISGALTGERFGWYQWISDGIKGLKDYSIASDLRKRLEADSSADNMISVVGDVIESAKSDGTYNSWMHGSFEKASIINTVLAETLKKMTIFNDVFATTNYDLLLERACGLKSLSYEQPGQVFEMLKSRQSHAVLHIHGIYDSVHGIDNIIADQRQYDAVLSDKGAQFIQNILGTRTLVFIGCGKTTDDVNIKQFVEFSIKHLKMDRTYFFLYNSSAPVTDLPDNIRPVPYGDEYEDLPVFLEDLAQERLRHRISKSGIIGKTAFDVINTTKDGILKYHFSQRSIPFCGRENELRQLREFVDNDKRFTWWAITGQAGAGKSRLAYEFIRELPASWFGFFIRDHALQNSQNSIEDYVPFCNALVVIDYVSGRERHVAESIIRLKQVFETTNYRLRILLLERDNTRETGSWYAKLLQRSSGSDSEDLKQTEYSDTFLYLQDLERPAVEKFISEVCILNGEPEDSNRDAELYELYEKKFERLQFRPLYVQLFVESWLINADGVPSYDDFSDILNELLIREQEKWLAFVNGDQAVCNACVRLIVRANISPLNIDDIPGLYKNDWDGLKKYIEENSFSGRQRGAFQDNLINSLCQNIDQAHKIVVPQFPDIIKEYMFSFYTDEEALSEMMKEIWQDAAADFSVFITRCLMDFKDIEFYKNAINAYKASTADTDVLIGRLAMLQNHLIQEGEDPRVYWDLIDNEHIFWNSVVVPEDEKHKDQIASLKIAGLYKVAQQIGTWSIYDMSAVMEVMDEIIEVDGDVGAETLKKTFLQQEINSLSTASFIDEARQLGEKLDVLLESSPENAFDSYIQMLNENNKMMNLIMEGEFEAAKEVLLEASRKCNREDINSARSLALSSFGMDQFSFWFVNYNTLGVGLTIVMGLESRYPEDNEIKARRIACQTVYLSKRFFVDGIGANELKGNLDELNKELSSMGVSRSEANEAFGVAWGTVKTLELNIATQTEIEEIIEEAGEILASHPKLSEVVRTKISAVDALHQKYLHTIITHAEIEELFRYVELNPESETVRNGFFDILKRSEDAGKERDYLNIDITREAFQDAKYNPLMGSGIQDIDLYQDFLNEMMTVSQPYVRIGKKVGRNDPCPCGSGNKFKRCCMGKGIYD